MAEKFSVDTNELAGLGAGTEDLAAYLGKIKSLVSGEAGPKDGWDGLMADLKGPFVSVQQSTASRYHQRQTVMYMTGNEVISLANLYKGTDAKSGNRIASVQPGAHDSYQDGDARTTATHFATGELPDLTPPASKTTDFRALLKDKASWVADIDEEFEKYAHWSPVNDAFEKVFGNWEDLSRIGEAYEKAGKGMAGAGKDFQSMSNKVKDHWDGKAADGYDEHAKRLANALGAEAPITKVVKDCLELLVEEIKKCVKALIDFLVEELKKEVNIDGVVNILKFWAKKIPVLGQAYQAERIIEILVKLAQEAKKLVEQVKKAVDLVNNVIEFLKDPVKFIEDKGKEKLDKSVGAQEDSDSKKKLLHDLPEAVVGVAYEGQAPSDAYSGGFGGDPWKDGQ